MKVCFEQIISGIRVVYARGAKGPLIGKQGTIVSTVPDEDGIVMVDFDSFGESPCWIGNLDILG